MSTGKHPVCVYNETTKRCAKKKEDKPDKIFNEKSKRWVLKTGVVGKRLLAEREVREKPKEKKKVRKEPKEKKLLTRHKSLKQKVSKKPEPVLPFEFEKLSDEVIEQILLAMDPADLKNTCVANKRIAAICAGKVFQKQYHELHEFVTGERPGQPMVRSLRGDIYSYV